MLHKYVMKKNNFTVKYKQEGCSLSDVISKEFSISKKQTRLWIDAKLVLVNRKRVWMRKHILKEGDFVEVLQLNNPTKTSKPISIIWEDQYYLIINKESGVLTNAAKNSLEEKLQKKKI